MENTLLNQDLQEEVKESFKIEDLEGATWAFRKLRAINTKAIEVKAIADAERSRINTWEDQQLKQFESDTEYFEYVLSEYYKTEKAKDSKFKLSTPYGKVSSRKASKWVYEDEETLKTYIKENNIDAIRIKEELDKTSLKKICKDAVNHDTGELLPGVTIEESETITVKAE